MNDSKGELLINNAVWSLIARLGSVAIKSFVIIYLARLLGPEQYGIFTSVVATTGIFAVFCDFGISASVAKFISEEKYPTKDLLNKAFSLIIGAYGIVLLVFAFFSKQLFELLNFPDIEGLLLLVIALVFFEILKKLLLKIYEGLRRVSISSKILLALEWAPWLLGILGAFFIGERAGPALLGRISGFFLLVVGLTFGLWKLLSPINEKQARKKISIGKLLTYALPLLLTSVSFYVYSQSDIILIQAIIGEQDVGLYGVAIQLLNMLHVPAAAIGTAVAASFVAYKKKGKEKARQLLFSVTKWLLIIYLPLSTGLLLTASSLIPLIFGDSYKASVTIVIIYIPFLFFKALSGTYSLALDYLGYAKKRAIAIAISAICNVLLNILLIPEYGIIGAAIATQITYVPVIIWYINMIFKDLSVELQQMFKVFLPIVFAATIMGILLEGIHYFWEFHILVIVAMGVFIYTILLFVFRILNWAEINRIIVLARS